MFAWGTAPKNYKNHRVCCTSKQQIAVIRLYVIDTVVGMGSQLASLSPSIYLIYRYAVSMCCFKRQI